MRRLLILLVAALLLSGCADRATDSVRITVVGDYSATADTGAVLDTMADLRPDASFALGDLSYGDLAPEAAWCDYVLERVGAQLPFQLLAGNHDSLDVPDGDIGAFADCLPNRLPGMVGDYGRQYSVDLPATDPVVRVIAISPGLTFADGQWGYRRGDTRYTWTREAIVQARNDGIDWVVVAAHNPCWSVGVHDCPATRDIYDLLIEQRVDLVLHAHEHSYARTFPLRAGVADCREVPVGAFDVDCVASTGNDYRAGAGTVFVTVGTGGMPLRESAAGDPEAGYFAAFNGSNVEPAHGLLSLDITAEEIRGAFVPAGDGTFEDTFRIAR